MSGRLSTALAWTLWALMAASILFGIALVVSVRSLAADEVMVAVAFNAFPFVGAIIVSRRPRNAVGWICLGIGLGTAITFLDAGYREYCTVLYGQLTPLSLWLDWVSNMVWPLNVSLAAALLMLFPTGRTVTPRWRWLLWVLVVDTILTVGSYAVLPGLFSGETITNPAGIPAWQGALVPLNNVAQAGQGIIVILAAALAIWRFWRSRGDERQQMKWFAYGVAAMVACIVLSVLFVPENNNALFAIGIIMIPTGIGIAVLRYRLYDIDVIINRTLVYASLTALLASVYFGSVVGLQHLAAALAGPRASGNPLIIVLSTLLIAALFTPLRQRIQRTIDRRFYRAKYDTARTLERFAASLRSEVELTDLSEHLVGVVEETMHPRYVSLWLQSPATPGGQTAANGREGGR